MTTKFKLKEGEVLGILIGRLRKSKSEVAEDLKISVQTLSKSFASELLTSNIKRKAANYLNVVESYFSGWYVPNLSESDFDSLNEPEMKYENKMGLDELTASEVMKYLEERDRMRRNWPAYRVKRRRRQRCPRLRRECQLRIRSRN